MQSSTMVVFRTLVMLGALVAVPVAAMFGPSFWPRLVRAVSTLTEDLETETSPADAPVPAAGIAPPQTPPAMPGQTGQAAPPPLASNFPTSPAVGDGSNAAHAAPSAPRGAPATLAVESHPPHAFPPPAAFPTTDASPLPQGDNRAQLAAPAFWSSNESAPSNAVVQVQHQEPLDARNEAVPQAASQAIYAVPAAALSTAPAAAAPPATAATDARQTAIEQRLQSIGALHYRLETAGPQGGLFRFQCKMGLEINPNYVSYFEATSSDPVTAMGQVLEQVESWRAGVARR